MTHPVRVAIVACATAFLLRNLTARYPAWRMSGEYLPFALAGLGCLFLAWSLVALLIGVSARNPGALAVYTGQLVLLASLAIAVHRYLELPFNPAMTPSMFVSSFGIVNATLRFGLVVCGCCVLGGLVAGGEVEDPP